LYKVEDYLQRLWSKAEMARRRHQYISETTTEGSEEEDHPSRSSTQSSVDHQLRVHTIGTFQSRNHVLVARVGKKHAMFTAG
jgi:hypothetical protein